MSDQPDPRIHNPETGERCRYQVLRHEITRCPLFKNYHGDHIILINILSWLDPQTNVSRVSIRQLQEGTGLCRNTVRKALKRLMGVEMIQPVNAKGKMRSYRVNWNHSWCHGRYVENETYFKHYPLNAPNSAAKRTEAARKGGERLKAKRENRQKGQERNRVKQDEVKHGCDRGTKDAPVDVSEWGDRGTQNAPVKRVDRVIQNAPVDGFDRGTQDAPSLGAWSASDRGTKDAPHRGTKDAPDRGTKDAPHRGTKDAPSNYFEVTGEVKGSKVSPKVVNEEEELTAQHTRSSECGDGDDGGCAKRAAHDLSAPSELIVHTPSGEAIASMEEPPDETLTDLLWSIKMAGLVKQRFGRQAASFDQKLSSEIKREDQPLFERSLEKIASVLVQKGHSLDRLFDNVNGQPLWKASLDHKAALKGEGGK